MTKQIQSMPDIWNDDKMFLTSKEVVLGTLANWAVQQSPYVLPENLEGGLREFWRHFDPSIEYFETNCENLMEKIRETFEQCFIIMEWNIAKKSRQIVNKYYVREADYDFIGLNALARNIAHSITLQARYDQLHNEE